MGSNMDAENQHRDLITDAPIGDFDADRFARGPFARRIAKTIMAQRDPGSLVVGIYGPWGDGKTSVLNLIEKTLSMDPNVATVRFNPWQLGDESLVFRGFFELLAKALDAKLVSGKAKAGDLLKQYGALLKPIPFAGDTISTAATAAGEAMAAGSTDLGEQKRKIDQILGNSGKRVVILMDDLDRLDKSEIQVIFRLVKVAADFEHTAYVLAFDDAVVSAALADRYATGSIHNVNFLEKIVQLPLHLPPVNQTELRKLTFETVEVALTQAEVELSQRQVNEFVGTFQRSITSRLKTPRVGKRYGNAVMFALPMIGDETNPVDLLLIEAMRIFFPPLYEWVRANREVVLGSGDALKGLIQSGFEAATSGLPAAEADGAKILLNYLLPRTESAWQNKSWHSSWDGTWAKGKRLCSRQYFDRYFTYAIPVGDIADAEADRLVKLFDSDANIDEAVGLALELLSSADKVLVTKLADRLAEVSPQVASNASVVLTRLGDNLSTRPEFLSMSLRQRVALLVSDLLCQMEPTDRFELTKRLIQTCQPLDYAIELYRRVNPEPDDEPSAGGEAAGPFDATAVGLLLADRIEKHWQGNPPIDALGTYTGSSLYIWQTYGQPAAVTTYLEERLKPEPGTCLPLIGLFGSERGSWSAVGAGAVGGEQDA